MTDERLREGRGAPAGETPGDGVPAELAPLLRRRWLLLGVGSDLRGDDAFGPLLARRVRAAGGPAVDGGAAPENVTGEVLRSGCEVLIVADAVEMGEEPGAVRLLDPAEIAETGISTHDASLGLLLRYLEGRRPLEVRVLALQPGPRELGAAPGSGVTAAADRLAASLVARGWRSCGQRVAHGPA